MEKIQEFTKEQKKKIETVLDKQYHRVTKATSIIQLLKVYHRQPVDGAVVTMEDIDIENVIDNVLELLEPVQSNLCETAFNAGHLLREDVK